MSSRPDLPRFFLSASPEKGGAELAPEEVQHATRVLRLGPGDELIGLDGVGKAWTLRISEGSNKRKILLEASGETLSSPRPGESGGPRHVSVAFSPPRSGRTEAMLERLTQLGVARILPVLCERTPPRSSQPSAARLDRWRRVLREATKQCGRLWLPELCAPTALAAMTPEPTAFYGDPRSEFNLREAAWSLDTSAPVIWIVGPEGGFTQEEQVRLLSCGARGARTTQHVLRIETAAELGAGLLLAR